MAVYMSINMSIHSGNGTIEFIVNSVADSQLTEGPFKNQLDKLLSPVISLVPSTPVDFTTSMDLEVRKASGLTTSWVGAPHIHH